ncbi:MAG: hypothetical protein ACJ75H_23965 [Thermoanaerobaculia bacterium]
MPKVSLADTLREWDSLLAGVDENEALHLPHLRELRARLAAAAEAVRELAAEQASLEARRRSVTQQLRITRQAGQDITVELRSAIRGLLGHRSERLVRYNIRPTRQRRRTVPETAGISVYARPDLLAAAGIKQASPQPPAAEPREEEPASPEEI